MTVGTRMYVWLVITALTREVGHSKDTEELESKVLAMDIAIKRSFVDFWLKKGVTKLVFRAGRVLFKVDQMERDVETRGYCYNLGNQLVFIEHLLSSRPYSRPWGHNRDKPETDLESNWVED